MMQNITPSFITSDRVKHDPRPYSSQTPSRSKDQAPSACMKERERKSGLQTSQPASMEKGKAGERKSRPATETYNYDARTGLVPATPGPKPATGKKYNHLVEKPVGESGIMRRKIYRFPAEFTPEWTGEE